MDTKLPLYKHSLLYKVFVSYTAIPEKLKTICPRFLHSQALVYCPVHGCSSFSDEAENSVLFASIGFSLSPSLYFSSAFSSMVTYFLIGSLSNFELAIELAKRFQSCFCIIWCKIVELTEFRPTGNSSTSRIHLKWLTSFSSPTHNHSSLLNDTTIFFCFLFDSSRLLQSFLWELFGYA